MSLTQYLPVPNPAPQVILGTTAYYRWRLEDFKMRHKHENEDELFIIHKGSMILEIEGESVVLNQGDVFLVEKGKEHRPIAEDVCEVILIEKKTTSHTGSVDSDITRSIDEQLRPL